MEAIQKQVDAVVESKELTQEKLHELAGAFWKLGDLAERPEVEASRELFNSLKALNGLFEEGSFEKKGGFVQREYRCLLGVVQRSNILTPNQSRTVADNLVAACPPTKSAKKEAAKPAAGGDMAEFASAFKKLMDLANAKGAAAAPAKKKGGRARKARGKGKRGSSADSGKAEAGAEE